MTEYGFIRATYTGVRAPHHFKQEVIFSGTPVSGVEPDFVNKAGYITPAGDGIEAMLTLIAPIFENVTIFGLIEVYWHTGDPIIGDQFIWGADFATPGSNGGSRVPLSEAVLSFKSTLGRKMKFYLMESVQPPNFRVLGSALVTPMNGLANYVVSDGSILCGAHHDFAFSCISMTSKTSDPLREQAGIA